MRERIIISLLLLFVFYAASCSNRRALKLIEKDKYSKAHDHLNKLIEKDSINPGANYIFSLLYLDSGYVNYNLDSSWAYIKRAQRQYKLIDEKKEKKLNKFNINESTLEKQKLKVDTVAFKVATNINTVHSYNVFLKTHPTAPQFEEAVARRNELAWQEAKKTNTYASYKQFMETYPDAEQIKDAEELYEILLYEEKTKDKKLFSYIQFLNDYPNTPYRKQAEKNIFELTTADNQPQSYLNFMTDYNKSPFYKKAIDFLFHIHKEENNPEYFFSQYNLPETDSIKQVISLSKRYIVPVLQEGKYGFFDKEWQQVLPFIYDDIAPEYYCGAINDDVLYVTQNNQPSIIANSGKTIYKQSFENFENIGYGLIKIDKEGQTGVIHKAGYQVLDFVFDDAAVVGGQFIKVKQNRKWGLFTFSSRKLLDEKFDDIFTLGPFMIFEKNGELAVTKANQVLKILDQTDPDLEFIYEEVELLDDNYLIGYRSDAETVIDQDLRNIFPLERHQIYQINNGWLIKRHGQYHLYNESLQPISESYFKKVDYNDQWLALKKEDKWAFITSKSTLSEGFIYDSLRLLSNNFTYLSTADSSFIYFQNGQMINIDEASKVQLLKPMNVNLKEELQNEYLSVIIKRKHHVYNILGEEILSGNYDQVSCLGNEYLLLDYRNKKGLADQSGELLLRTIYDGIGNYNNGYVSLLRNRRFGIYNQIKNVNISPGYEALLKPYNDSLLLAAKRGKWGMIDLDNQKVMDFKYKKIEYWTDSTALVQNDENKWQIAEFDGEVIYDNIYDYSWIKNDASEKVIQINIDAKYGVISNRKGEVISPTFNDIVNIGTTEEPIYFTEKNIREAAFFVVIYYDNNGNILRREAFTADEYDRIYCDY